MSKLEYVLHHNNSIVEVIMIDAFFGSKPLSEIEYYVV